jgi:XrtJ-associated TM-motif-TM protein
MNLKKTILVFGFPLMLVMASSLCAQTGCTDSPEDPTLVLAVVGGAGATVMALVRNWRRNR